LQCVAVGCSVYMSYVSFIHTVQGGKQPHMTWRVNICMSIHVCSRMSYIYWLFMFYGIHILTRHVICGCSPPCTNSSICVICHMTYMSYVSCVIYHITYYVSFICVTYEWDITCVICRMSHSYAWHEPFTLQCVLVCCSGLQCVAVGCSVYMSYVSFIHTVQGGKQPLMTWRVNICMP